MRILLDSNVIIAAFATRGLCNELFEVCLANHTILLSQQLLDEIEKNLIKKIKLPINVGRQISKYLKSIAALEMITTTTVDPSICRDPDDLKVLELAAQGAADYIVTGDPDLLVLKHFEGVPILSPREFWIHLTRRIRNS